VLTRYPSRQAAGVDSSWVLNSQKSWTTNAPVADVFLVMTFLIEEGTLQAVPSVGPLDKMGMRTAMMGQLTLRDCPASDERTASMQLHGARGYMVERGLEKQLPDALASQIYSRTIEVQKVILAAYLGL
jgi:alkylation response protein AidB-like acyl-CoA dehydrogenase